MLAVIGAASPCIDAKQRAFLLLWMLVPITRVVLPGMRDFDGVRHFRGFYPAMVVLAAIGLRSVARLVARITGESAAPLGRGALAAVAVVPGVVVTAQTHPNGTCYFNAFVGGLDGSARYPDLDAVDYWGNAYWQGLTWLNENAAGDASLVVPVAEHIVQCVVPVRLRSDIRYVRFAKDPPERVRAPLYVMHLIRKGTYGPMLAALREQNAPVVHEIRVQGGVILRILRVDGEAAARAAALMSRESRVQPAVARILAWIQEDPQQRLALVWQLLAAVPVVGEKESERRIHAILPESLHRDGSDVVWKLARTR